MKKDFWKELHNFKNKCPDDPILAEVILEMKRKKETDDHKAKIEATKEHYLKEKKSKITNIRKPLS